MLDPNILLQDMRFALRKLGERPVGNGGYVTDLCDMAAAAELLDELGSAGILPDAWKSGR